MEEIRIFNNEEFGKIRTTVIDGEPWFVNKDICSALGIANYRRTLKNFVKPQDKGMCLIETDGGLQNMVVINESGLFNIIFGTRSTNTEKFKDWILSDVLPSLRKGEFKFKELSENLTIEPEQIKTQGYVYAVEWGDNKVKIGKTINPKKRFQNLERTAKYNEEELGFFHISPSHNNYSENEKKLHKKFKNKRIDDTELFTITLDEAKEAFESLDYDEELIEVRNSSFLNDLKNEILKGLLILSNKRETI